VGKDGQVDSEQVSWILFEVANDLILPRFGAVPSTQEIEVKTRPGDIATAADREGEREIARRLRAEYPDAVIVGEESVYSNPRLLDGYAEAEHAFVIDPLDGTLNFTRESTDFGVMVAEIKKGVTTRGWIYHPMYRTIWVAEKGAGVTRNGQPVSYQRPERDGLIGATYIPFKLEGELPAHLRRTWGSCAIDYPKLIEGEVDFLAYRSMFPWDHLPGALMVTELGGFTAVEDGTPWAAGVQGKRLMSAMTPENWHEADRLLEVSNLYGPGTGK
jgi:fructose-1,6-bisphosphatase/inositol monophosphatase family enzyme